MRFLTSFAQLSPKLTSAILWTLAGLITIGCFTYQDKTGPTYPMAGEISTAQGVAQLKFLRSETIGTDLKIMLLEPVPVGVTGYVKYRRYKSDDDWQTLPMERGLLNFLAGVVSSPCRGSAQSYPASRSVLASTNTWSTSTKE